MGQTLTAQDVSFEQQGPNRYELIVSPNRESLVQDLANSAKATKIINEMRGRGFFVHQRRRHDGGLIVNFSK